MAHHVLLTGGNGFIAAHIMEILLQRGYNVTTTVRSESKTKFLRSKFANAINDGQLKLAIVEDITVPGGFDDIIRSNKFDAVLHTSSPFFYDTTDSVNDLLRPAINGTLGILRSIKAHGPSVKRVVVTSSFAAVIDVFQGDRPGYVYTEKDWNPITEEQGTTNGPALAYVASKTFAERAAWDFVKNETPGFDLSTICPPIVYGPTIQEVTDLNKLNTSSTDNYVIFSGQQKELRPASSWIWVDVRDAALAHVLAIEKPEAGGKRFLTSEGTFNVGQVVDTIWKYYPERAQAKGIPKSSPQDGYPAEGVYTLDNSQSRKILGLEFNTFENMLKDQLDQFVVLEKQLGVE